MWILELLGFQKKSRGRSPGAEEEAKDALKARAQTVGTISARVIRANGDIEDLGVIAAAYREE